MKRFIALLLCVFGSLAASSRAEVELSLDFYYDQLSPHGEWAEVEGYGQVWHPAGVDDDWAPYSDGYWTYTDAGWTWVSYEDWGGICYHYGRWTRVADYGWCWVPGYEWGPAWVSWRKSEEHVGWAPLPPECDWEEDRGVGVWVDVNYDIGPRYYNFCRIQDFGAPVIRHVLFPRIRNVDICFSTVNITNISYNRGYGCVYNGGFDYDYIRARCERPIPTLKLVQNTTNIFINNNGGNVFVNAPRGNALVVAAPRVATNYRQFTRKPAALRSFRRDTVTRGWAGVDQAETRQRLVSKMREETKGLTPTNAPARPVRQESLAVVPKQVDLEARPTGLRRQTAERPSRAPSAAVQIPVDSAAITTPSREGRIGKMRPEHRGETADKPTSTERPVAPTDRPVTEPRGRVSEAPIASKEESTGGLRKRPGRLEGEGNQPAVTEPGRGRVGVEDRGNEAGKPERMVDPRENGRIRRTEQDAPATGNNKPNRAAEMRDDAQERAARQAQENAVKERAVRENADRQSKQREQAEAVQDAAERAQRQRGVEMQRDAQENANRAARENAVRENAARENAARENVENARRAQEMRNTENAARAERQRQANDQAEAAQRQAAQRATAERQLENQRRQSMERQADAQRERAAEQQNDARQRQMEAARERANDAQRERAMDVQRQRAAAAQAQQNEARQRQADANRENAMNAQRERAAAAQAQQRAAAQAEAQQQRAAAQAQQRAAAQAQAQQQQRAAAQAQAQQQQRAPESRGSNSGSDEDPRKKKNR